MSYKKALLDVACIVIGAGISIFFVSGSGNGQNPVPVAGEIAIVVLANGLVSFLIARFVTKLPVAIIESAILTNILFIVYSVRDLAYNSSDKYAGEAALMFPTIFTVSAAPTIVLGSIGFGRMAGRFWRKSAPSVKKNIPDSKENPEDTK